MGIDSRADHYAEQVAYSVGAYIDSPATVKQMAPHIAAVIEDELQFSSTCRILDKHSSVKYGYTLPTNLTDLRSTVSRAGILGVLHAPPLALEIFSDYYENKHVPGHTIASSLVPGAVKFGIGVTEGFVINAISKTVGVSCGAIAWPLMVASTLAEMPNITTAMNEAWQSFPGFPEDATLSQKAAILREFQEEHPLLNRDAVGVARLFAGGQHVLEFTVQLMC